MRRPINCVVCGHSYRRHYKARIRSRKKVKPRKYQRILGCDCCDAGVCRTMHEGLKGLTTGRKQTMKELNAELDKI